VFKLTTFYTEIEVTPKIDFQDYQEIHSKILRLYQKGLKYFDIGLKKAYF